MCKFFKKLFGKKEKPEQVNQRPIEKDPIDVPMAEGYSHPSDGQIVSKVREDVQKNEELTPEPEEEVTVESFEEKVFASEEPKEEPVKEPKEENEEEKEEDKDENVYDVKKHPKGWQVILPGAQRATRVLNTQQEAIDYCRENDYKFQVYKMDGTLKK